MWENFAYELKRYFNEWIKGVKVDNFEKLCNLIIADQMKRKISQEVRDHFIDDWPKLISPDDLAEKLDDYDTLRSTFKHEQPRKDGHFERRDSFKNDLIASSNERKRQFSTTHNEMGEPKCFNCNCFGDISKDCPHPKTVITCRRCGKPGHKANSCTAKTENNNSNEKSLSVTEVGDRLYECAKYLKEAKINDCRNIEALVDTGSSCCLLRISAAQKLGLRPEPAVNELYGFGSQIAPAVIAMGRIKADIEVDNVKGQNINIYIVPDHAQPVDLLIGRSWLDLPYIAYARIGNTFHISYHEDEPFSKLIIDEKVNRICLKALKEIKEVERNLNNTVNKTLGKTPFEILHGYVPRFKDGILRLFADENAEVWNDPEKLQLKAKEKFEKEQQKMKEYYDKKKYGTLSFEKGEIVVVKRNPRATGESTKTQPRYRGPMVVTEILPGDTYRISQLEENSGHLYAKTAHVSQLKAWKNWNEDDDDSSADSEEELERQRPKRTVRKPLRYRNVT